MSVVKLEKIKKNKLKIRYSTQVRVSRTYVIPSSIPEEVHLVIVTEPPQLIEDFCFTHKYHHSL